MKNLSKHAEWLSLIEISGPFLTVSMLDKVFPQGLEAVETPRRQKLRAAYEEWREAVDQEDRLLPELHREWVRLVLTEMLEYDQESLVHACDWPDELPSVSSQEHAGTFKPDWIVRSPADVKPRLFIAVLPPDTDLESVQRGDGWPVSLQERMTLLCRAHGVRVGLLTDGERWMLVNSPVGSTSSQASWYARLWFQEPITLKAFQSLLGAWRCFGPEEGTLESLLDESLKHHEEVTDTLGEQVRRAVEVLVQCLDKADEDRNRELLHDVKPAELYEAGLTVMMRLVFVLCAEERGLLLLGDSVYDRHYAVSTLRGQLAEEADRHGPEVLDRRHDAWARLLAVFRAIYGGIEHESLRMPALGGSLFDPDRFPFLEGRAKGTGWRDTSAAPLPIDNRTVLLLLNSLQILEQSGGALLLSYRALDVEQIGHVYEGLLEHTVARVPRVTLGLQGSQKAKNPNVALAELESARLDGEAALVRLVLDVTGRSESAIGKGLSKPADDTVFGRVLGVCGGDTALAERIRPFTNLLRTDAWDDPIVYRDNSFMVTLGADRRETGTHYTPKSLTESIVTTTLEPVVYVGPAEGKPREEWTLKSSREILDLKVCDPAMGSGAFLVQACRYLGEKLVEAWLHEESAGKAITVDGEALDQLGAEEPLPSQLDERLTIARRLVAERCLYGVDINPLAVELAKLSIWLVTLAKSRPFGFLDHNLRSGDSLLGIHRLDQLTQLSVNPTGQGQLRLFGQNIERAVLEAIELRQHLRKMPIRDVRDVEAMAHLDTDARRRLEVPESIADAFIGEVFTSGGGTALENALASLTVQAGQAIDGDRGVLGSMRWRSVTALTTDLPTDRPVRRPFHWPLEFPEVFVGERKGFDAVVANPPYIGGRLISGNLGRFYYNYLDVIREGRKGSPDLCVFFLLRAYSLLGNAGTVGMVVTALIKDTGNRTVGLDHLVRQDANIILAISQMPWPGMAMLDVSIIVLCRGAWHGFRSLDGKVVHFISGGLDTNSDVEIYDLKTFEGKRSDGYKLMGEGFVLSEQELVSIEQKDPTVLKIVHPYFGGEDIVESIRFSPDRWAIDFEDRSENESRMWCDAFSRVKELVKPFRDAQKGQIHQDCFWKYWDMRQSLRIAQLKLTRYLVTASNSKYLVFRFQSGHTILNQKTKIIFSEEYSVFAILQSTIHDVWARWRSGSRGAGSIAYSTSKALSTFPLPEYVNNHALDGVGVEYFESRQAAFESLSVGPTQFYNLFHTDTERGPRIQRLRVLQSEMDNVVARAYGWDDLDLEHGFHEIPSLPENDRIRFTISETARIEVLRRLSKLNHQRYEEGLTSSGLRADVTPRNSPRASRTGHASGAATAQSLFDFEVIAATAVDAVTPTTAILSFLRAHDGWHAKSDVLAATGIMDGQWKTAIADLISGAKVERQGERRGARYRIFREEKT